MSFLLDTDICSTHLKRPSGLMYRFVQHSGGLFIPTRRSLAYVLFSSGSIAHPVKDFRQSITPDWACPQQKAEFPELFEDLRNFGACHLFTDRFSRKVQLGMSIVC